MGSLKGFETLKTTKEFSDIYNNGKKWHFKGAVVFYKSGLKKRVGITASKKIGNSVKRNLTKRRLRALMCEFSENLHEGSYVIVAKESINKMSYESLKRDLLWSFSKLGCLKQ